MPAVRRSLALFVLLALTACQRPSSAGAPAVPAAKPVASPAVVAPSPRVALPDFTQLVEEEGKAVVNISTTQTVTDDGNPFGAGQDDEDAQNDPFFQFFKRFGPSQPRTYQARSLGSGFIVKDDGLILTNAHVVSGAETVTVKLADQREFKAKVLGVDKRTDVAVLKIPATHLPIVRLGSAEKLKAGEWVVAIGSPFGLEQSVTAGIVSAKGRRLPDSNEVSFIQTDVAVNPGNSGGPLFNLAGEVVGINSQIYTRSGGYMGLSFAVPIDLAQRIAGQLETGGHVERGRLGVQLQPLTNELAASFGLDNTKGGLITNVDRDSPAAKAGLKAGDVILAYQGETIASADDLPAKVANTKPGSKVTLRIWRNRAAQDVSLNVGRVQDEDDQAAPAKQAANAHRLGLALRPLDDATRQRTGADSGVLIVGAEGPAANAGIQPGDVLTAVNTTAVNSVADVQRAVEAVPTGKPLALRLLRDGQALYVSMKRP